MDQINCVFCDIDSNDVVIEENGFTGRKCSQCGLIYISPRPSREEVYDLYGHDDAHIPAAAHIGGDFAKRLAARHNLGLIRRFIQSGSLLEVGAGGGYFLDEARKSGFEPYAIEFNPIQARHIRDVLAIPCAESPLDSSLFDGKVFEVIYHCDVVSHFFDPIEEFIKMHSLIGDNGLLVFETGNFGDMGKAYFRYIKRFQYPDHLFFFSTANLHTLLEQSGFEIEGIYRYSIMPQMRFINALVAIKNLVSRPLTKAVQNAASAPKTETQPMSPVREVTGARSGLKQGLRNSYHYLGYLLRYKLGRLMVRTDQPQTVVVIARKRN